MVSASLADRTSGRRGRESLRRTRSIGREPGSPAVAVVADRLVEQCAAERQVRVTVEQSIEVAADERPDPIAMRSHVELDQPVAVIGVPRVVSARVLLTWIQPASTALTGEWEILPTNSDSLVHII